MLGAGLGALYRSRKKTSAKCFAKEHSVRPEDFVGSLGNLDHAPARRRVRSLFQATQQSLDHILLKVLDVKFDKFSVVAPSLDPKASYEVFQVVGVAQASLHDTVDTWAL
ncbi:hypothetical protein L7F22_064547 [Adiantum nelumboides]|nr:hypothetical protein [Adiantum nelumboides]